MTKKHFEEMASYIRANEQSRCDYQCVDVDERNEAFLYGMRTLAIHIGKTFGKRFDVDRFEKACEA